MQDELAFHYEKALQALSPHERLVFELKHYQGLSLHSVSEVTGIKGERIRKLFVDATAKLRAFLSQESEKRSENNRRAHGSECLVQVINNWLPPG